MIKKIFFILFALIISQTNCFAINWQEVKSYYKNTAFVDMDSVAEKDGAYFYNIKIINEATNDYVVLTIQSLKSNPFCARIRAYTLDEYNLLNGDYQNITKNATKDFETISYQSILYACDKKVKAFKKHQEMRKNIIIQQ